MSTDAAEGEMARLDWPAESVVYLTLDLECDYGTALAENTYTAHAAIEDFTDVLERHDVSLTCFVQTAVLDAAPESVETLREADFPVTFHAHSHTHPPRRAGTVAEEVALCTDRFEDYFGERPNGYRFPDGDVRPEDYAVLAEYDYQFDASVVPTWRPGRFTNLRARRVPTYCHAADVVELPFTVYGRYLPIPTSLSSCGFFGAPYRRALARRPPRPLVFNVHLHDLFSPPAMSALPRRYRLVYRRCAEGLSFLDEMLRAFRTLDYRFDHLDAADAALRATYSV